MDAKVKDKELAMQAVDIMKWMSEEWRVEFLLMIIDKYEKELEKADSKKESGEMKEGGEMKEANYQELPKQEWPKPPMTEEQMMQFAGSMF